jgi:predicted transcriptional regulator
MTSGEVVAAVQRLHSQITPAYVSTNLSRFVEQGTVERQGDSRPYRYRLAKGATTAAAGAASTSKAQKAPQKAPRRVAPLPADATFVTYYLVELLEEHGYTLTWREDVWWEVFIARPGEIWFGGGATQGDAVADGVRKMCGPSLLASNLVDAAVAARHRALPEETPAVDAVDAVDTEAPPSASAPEPTGPTSPGSPPPAVAPLGEAAPDGPPSEPFPSERTSTAPTPTPSGAIRAEQAELEKTVRDWIGGRTVLFAADGMDGEFALQLTRALGAEVVCCDRQQAAIRSHAERIAKGEYGAVVHFYLHARPTSPFAAACDQQRVPFGIVRHKRVTSAVRALAEAIKALGGTT